MNIKAFIVFVIVFVIVSMALISCSENKPVRSNSSSTVPEVKKGVTPLADSEIAVIEMENSAAFGTIKIELYSNVAPKMVARFKELAKEGFYNGTSFHRINLSVIQGGDPLSKDAADNEEPKTENKEKTANGVNEKKGEIPKQIGSGKSDKPDVEAEFSDILYETGIVGAARSQDFNSANSQFFITLKREAAFDNKYTIFGKVIEGMNNARTISGVEPKTGERPVEDVKIKSITIQPKN